MFSLIVVIISILLVGLLIAATVYFGGSAFSDGRQKAELAQLENEGQQIAGAAALHHVQTGAYATDVKALVTNTYLSAVPQLKWEVRQDTAIVSGISESQCATLNAKAGVTTAPLCTDPAVAGLAVCCQWP